MLTTRYLFLICISSSAIATVSSAIEPRQKKTGSPRNPPFTSRMASPIDNPTAARIIRKLESIRMRSSTLGNQVAGARKARVHPYSQRFGSGYQFGCLTLLHSSSSYLAFPWKEMENLQS